MMKEKLKYLAINTSDENYLEIELFLNNEIYKEIIEENRGHLKFLIPGIRNILEKHSLKLKDLDFIAINEGPGSWTGLRIGFSTIKVLALINNLKIITFNNFELFQNENNIHEGLFLIKASNSKFYYKKIIENNISDGIIDSSDLEKNLTDTKYFLIKDKFSPHKLIQNKFSKNEFSDIFEVEPYYISEGLIKSNFKNEK